MAHFDCKFLPTTPQCFSGTPREGNFGKESKLGHKSLLTFVQSHLTRTPSSFLANSGNYCVAVYKAPKHLHSTLGTHISPSSIPSSSTALLAMNRRNQLPIFSELTAGLSSSMIPISLHLPPIMQFNSSNEPTGLTCADGGKSCHSGLIHPLHK